LSIREITLRRADGVVVAARLHEGLTPEELLAVEAQWSPERKRLRQELDERKATRAERPESLYWNWEKKAPLLRAIEAAAWVIECDGKWQGAMLTRTALRVSRHQDSTGKPLVYVDFVEAAPWNLDIAVLGQKRTFSRVGSVLLREAVLQSHDLEFEGRVGLHSLSKAEGFYAKLGFVQFGYDADKEDLMYFELTKEGARRFLDGG
jgi:hypothetical protein